MKLYLISQSQNSGHDTYSRAVVCASSPDKARQIIPNADKDTTWGSSSWDHGWCRTPSHVDVEYIGRATRGVKTGTVLASFHAG